MVRRTQQQHSTFGWLLRSAGGAGAIGLLGLAMPGCGAPGPTPASSALPDTSHLNRDQLSVYGDDLQIYGRKVRDQGIASGDDVMKHRGQAIIVQGQQLIDRATTLGEQSEQSGPVPGITHSPY